jgi:hypothetical protein
MKEARSCLSGYSWVNSTFTFFSLLGIEPRTLYMQNTVKLSYTPGSLIYFNLYRNPTVGRVSYTPSTHAKTWDEEVRDWPEVTEPVTHKKWQYSQSLNYNNWPKLWSGQG